jgi:hypothetical protein
MPHTAYPIVADLDSYLRALGILSDADLAAFLANVDLEGLIEAAVDAWEMDTGWIPFLRDSTPVSRRFDPPGPNRRTVSRGGHNRLDLAAGLLEVTAFVTGYSSTDAGTAAVLEDDYWLWPANAAIENRPWTLVEFAASSWGGPQSIQITGYWGYSATIPGDAWQAILRQAGLLAYSEITLQLTGGMVGWSEADVKEEYDLSPLELHRKAWQEQWDRAVNRYRRAYL